MHAHMHASPPPREGLRTSIHLLPSVPRPRCTAVPPHPLCWQASKATFTRGETDGKLGASVELKKAISKVSLITPPLSPPYLLSIPRLSPPRSEHRGPRLDTRALRWT